MQDHALGQVKKTTLFCLSCFGKLEADEKLEFVDGVLNY